MQHNNRGFTLVELLIVVAIVGILAAIVIPSYQGQIDKSRRADAKVALEQTAQQLNRCFVAANTFVYDAANAPSCPQSYTTNDGHYTITVAAAQSTFTLTAQATGVQSRDTSCYQMLLTSTGSRTSKDDSGTATSGCW